MINTRVSDKLMQYSFSNTVHGVPLAMKKKVYLFVCLFALLLHTSTLKNILK